MKFSIDIKILSVNKAWKGRRFKSDDYKQYETDVYRLLTGVPKAPEGALQVHYKFYMVNHKLADNDNPVKPLQDILKLRGIIKDDRFIYRTIIDKIPAKKERIEVEIQNMDVPAMV